MFQTKDGSIFEQEIEARWYQFFQECGINVEVMNEQFTFQFRLNLPHGSFPAGIVDYDEDREDSQFDWLEKNNATMFLLPNRLQHEIEIFTSDRKFIKELGFNPNEIDIIPLYGMIQECNCGNEPKHISIMFVPVDIAKFEWNMELEEQLMNDWLSDNFDRVNEMEFKELSF